MFFTTNDSNGRRTVSQILCRSIWLQAKRIMHAESSRLLPRNTTESRPNTGAISGCLRLTWPGKASSTWESATYPICTVTDEKSCHVLAVVKCSDPSSFANFKKEGMNDSP